MTEEWFKDIPQKERELFAKQLMKDSLDESNPNRCKTGWHLLKLLEDKIEEGKNEAEQFMNDLVLEISGVEK